MINIQIKVPNWLDRIIAWPVMRYRLFKFGYTYRKIYLDEGKWTILDTQDYYRYACFKWCIGGDKDNLYAVRGQLNGPVDMKMVRLHRLIMAAPKGLLVDHHNGDSLDNRRANLRLATNSQNQFNRRKRENTTSRFKGVYFHKVHRKWAAQITIRGKRIFLGYFHSEIKAARTYDKTARKYHKEFARLNFPEDKAGACPP